MDAVHMNPQAPLCGLGADWAVPRLAERGGLNSIYIYAHMYIYKRKVCI